MFIGSHLRWGRRQRLGTAQAFTLVELMVVMVLIGILTAMIIPEMKGSFEDALLRSTSRELVNAFSLASSRAVSVNQVHRVRLDNRAGRYVVERRVHQSGRKSDFVPVPDVAGAQGELDARISVDLRRPSQEGAQAAESEAAPAPAPERDQTSLSDGIRAISFYPDGTADAAEILLRDRDGFRLVLRINPITARVRILERARE